MRFAHTPPGRRSTPTLERIHAPDQVATVATIATIAKDITTEGKNVHITSAQYRNLAAALVAVLAAAVANADTYKCRDASGGTVYQQVPCVPGAALGAISAPSRPGTEQRQPLTPGMMGIMMTLGFKRWCDGAVPGFAEKVAPDWNRWRSDNLASLRGVETDRMYLDSLQKPAEPGGAYRRDNARFVCTPQWVRELSRKEPAAGFATSPEGTWRHLIAALSRADREAVLSCYSMESRVKYGPVLEALTDEQLKRQAASWKLVGNGGADDQFREYFVQDEGRAHLIYFFNFGGKWLITEM